MNSTISVSQLLDLVSPCSMVKVGDMLTNALRISDEREVSISAVRSAEFRQIYDARWKRIKETGVPETLGFAEFVDGLSDDFGTIWMFSLTTGDWLLVGYLLDGLLELGGVLALKRDPT